MKNKKIMNIIISLLIFVAVICVFYFVMVARVPKTTPEHFGVTFSKIHAEGLNLDWKQAYQAIFDDLGIKKIRIPVYWQEVEPQEGEFSAGGGPTSGWDFSSIDFMMDVADANGGEIILAIGNKVPRWPECHQPDWANNESQTTKNEKLLKYIETTIKRYNDRSSLKYFQIENEPFLKFGICPDYNPYFIDEEIKLAKTLTDKPIIVTDGGEFGDWFRAYKRADIFGSTMYRHIVSKYIGEWTYPIPPSYFRFRRAVVEMFYGKKPSIVAELQAEPWSKKSWDEMSAQEQYEFFGPKRFDEMMEYIKGTGFDTFYFWGVEWWYWLKETHDAPEMWELAKEAVTSTNHK